MKQAIMVDEKARMGYIIKMEERMEMLRIKAKLSQGDLAQLSGFSRQNYNMVVNGKHHLSWRNYLALLFIFDTTAPPTPCLENWEFGRMSSYQH